MTYTAFQGETLLVTGDFSQAAEAAARAMAGGAARVLVLDDDTGAQVDADPTAAAPLEPAKPARGRPKLGVVAREVTLLPRHWEWLSEQSGGASATLRRLVEEARRAAAPTEIARRSQTTVYRAMTSLAGDLPNYEEALRALYARNDAQFDLLIADWPTDVRAYVAKLAAVERRARIG